MFFFFFWTIDFRSATGRVRFIRSTFYNWTECRISDIRCSSNKIIETAITDVSSEPGSFVRAHANGRTDGRTDTMCVPKTIDLCDSTARSRGGGNSNKINTKMFLKFNYSSTRSGRTIARAHYYYFTAHRHRWNTVHHPLSVYRIFAFFTGFAANTSIGCSDVPRGKSPRQHTPNTVQIFEFQCKKNDKKYFCQTPVRTSIRNIYVYDWAFCLGNESL